MEERGIRVECRREGSAEDRKRLREGRKRGKRGREEGRWEERGRRKASKCALCCVITLEKQPQQTGKFLYCKSIIELFSNAGS
jgi:hypothetical protein